MEVIDEDSINRWIVPHLSVGKRGPEPQASAAEIFQAILYRLKTGCQWRRLPVKEFFSGRLLSWQGVYYHFKHWAADGSLREVWVELLRSQRRLLNLSCVQLDSEPDPVQERRGACGLPGQTGGQELQQPLSLRQQGGDAGLQPARLRGPP